MFSKVTKTIHVALNKTCEVFVCDTYKKVKLPNVISLLTYKICKLMQNFLTKIFIFINCF